jgi:hypothetical protein
MHLSVWDDTDEHDDDDDDNDIASVLRQTDVASVASFLRDRCALHHELSKAPHDVKRVVGVNWPGGDIRGGGTAVPGAETTTTTTTTTQAAAATAATARYSLPRVCLRARSPRACCRVAGFLSQKDFELDCDAVDVETSVGCALEHIHIPLSILGVPRQQIPNPKSRRHEFLVRPGWTLLSASANAALWIPSEGGPLL